jgi:O-antigen ligase
VTARAAGWLGIVLVGLFGTDLSLFGFEHHWLPEPVAFYAGFGLAAALLAWFRPEAARVLAASRFALWLVCFLGVSLAWFFMTIQDAAYWAFLRQRLYSLGFITTCVLVLSFPEARRTARAALVGAVLLGVGLNLVDAAQPLTFTPFLGRSTGLYLNPNVAGAALVMGALAAWEIVPERWRALFYGLVLLGVLPTFSRSAILLALLLGPALCWAGQMGWKGWGLAVLVAGGLAVCAAAMLAASGLIPADGAVMQDLVLRVSLSADDYSTEDRLLVLREALAMISRAPWLGHGTGASYLWALDRSSHNMYLNLMVDHGGWAGLLLPALFASLARRTVLCGLYLACWAILGLVSHNLLDETAFMALLAFTPYLGETSSR